MFLDAVKHGFSWVLHIYMNEHESMARKFKHTHVHDFRVVHGIVETLNWPHVGLTPEDQWNCLPCRGTPRSYRNRFQIFFDWTINELRYVPMMDFLFLIKNHGLTPGISLQWILEGIWRYQGWPFGANAATRRVTRRNRVPSRKRRRR